MELGRLHYTENNNHTRFQNSGHQWQPKKENSGGIHMKPLIEDIYRPDSAAEILLYPVSTSFIDSYSKSGPLGSTVYKKDFSWKPACKPECIRTGTASGQRRNNPHPSQSFMMWRLPRDSTRSYEYAVFPSKCSPSEGDIRKALTAQYHSTYSCDFMGMPQGCDRISRAERRLGPKQSRRELPPSSETEMRDNYRKPKQKPELLHCKADPNVTCHGIVPTVVQRHVYTQQKRSDLTNYDRFCGKRVNNVKSVIKSLLPEELEQLHRILPEEEKEAVKRVLNKETYPNNKAKVSELPAVVLNSCSPEWISNWPGPL